MNIKLREIAKFSFVSMYLGIALFCAILAWDRFAGVHVAHNEGLGWMQILALAGSGMYSMWAWAINLKWEDYIKKIHGKTE